MWDSLSTRCPDTGCAYALGDLSGSNMMDWNSTIPPSNMVSAWLQKESARLMTSIHLAPSAPPAHFCTSQRIHANLQAAPSRLYLLKDWPTRVQYSPDMIKLGNRVMHPTWVTNPSPFGSRSRTYRSFNPSIRHESQKKKAHD